MGKGLDAPTIIAIIIAIVAGIVILYFLWSRGFLPFLGGASEADCRAYFIRACGGETKYWSEAEKGNCFRFLESWYGKITDCNVPTDLSQPNCQTNICEKII